MKSLSTNPQSGMLGGRFGIRITTSTNVEDHDENENRANDIEIALARPKQTRLRRRPEQVFSCHLSLRDLSTTSRETNRVEGRRHIAIVPSATYPSNVQTTTTLGIHQQRWLRKVVDLGSAVTSRPVRILPTIYAAKHRDRDCFNSDHEFRRPGDRFLHQFNQSNPTAFPHQT